MSSVFRWQLQDVDVTSKLLEYFSPQTGVLSYLGFMTDVPFRARARVRFRVRVRVRASSTTDG